MAEKHTAGNGAVEEAKLPARDLWLLPLVSLCTISLCLLGAEAIASFFFVSQVSDACRVYDPMLSFRYRANCITRMKVAEGPWVINQYNDCGYRTKESCASKPKGTTRIALLGSSASEGLMVSYDEGFASRIGRELTSLMKRPVEVQNLGRERCSPLCVFHRVDEALELRPDIVVLALSNFDIQFLDPSPVPDLNSPPRAESPLTFWGKFLLGLKENKATLAATYLLMKYNPEFSRLRVQTYVKRGGSSEYLWTPLPGPWEARVQALDVIIGMIEDRCRKANVPFVLVELPTFQQDFLLKSRDLAPGVDPYQLSGRLNKIAVKHEVQFISTLNAFKEGPDPNDVFYAVDGHMNAEGHSMVAGVLVKELQATLSSGPTPGLEVGDRPRRTLGYEQ